MRSSGDTVPAVCDRRPFQILANVHAVIALHSEEDERERLVEGEGHGGRNYCFLSSQRVSLSSAAHEQYRVEIREKKNLISKFVVEFQLCYKSNRAWLNRYSLLVGLEKKHTDAVWSDKSS